MKGVRRWQLPVRFDSLLAMYKTSKQTTLPTLLATGVALLTTVAACSGSDAAEDERE